MSCEQVWDEWEQFLLDDLKESRCWLSFHDGSAEVLVGLGVGDAAHSLTPELSAETYDNIDRQWPAQVQDIKEQIEGIDAFMLDLKKLARATDRRVGSFAKKTQAEKRSRNMTREDVVHELTTLRDEYQRNYKRYEQQRDMRPSERAMTLAHYSLKISALQYAITELS